MARGTAVGSLAAVFLLGLSALRTTHSSFEAVGWGACVGLLCAVAVLGAVAGCVSWPARAGVPSAR
ncbi:hypothetical protein SAMN05660350_00635 [Geodermatophilus obscurus]|uniref:Uncharacterized protein n=1 Tax=Geodermatophilus obscurus TaxID=1861 RepID=A0A1M7SBS4_9ACTN|nr:hypothetical protein [Geodermatophilus obscurus]SHN55951.1 hypothetical protein SAMN05660350_00635 [Geodermatophilus obscurus]